MLRLGAVAIAVLVGMGQAWAVDKAWRFEDGAATVSDAYHTAVYMQCDDLDFVTTIKWDRGNLDAQRLQYVTFRIDPGTPHSASLTAPISYVTPDEEHLSHYEIQGKSASRLAILANLALTSIEVSGSGRADARAGDDDFFHIATLPAAGASAAVVKVRHACASSAQAELTASQAPSEAPQTGEWFTDNEGAAKAAVVLADADISLSFSCQNAGTVFDFSMPDDVLDGPLKNRTSFILLLAVDPASDGVKRWRKVDLNPKKVGGRTHFIFRGSLADRWSALAMKADHAIEIALAKDVRDKAAYNDTVFSAKGSMPTIRGVLSGCR